MLDGIKKNELFSKIRKNSVVSLIVAFLSFLSTMILARLLGAENFGVYKFSITILNLATLLTTLGFPSLIIREAAIYRSKNEWKLLRGLFVFSRNIAVILSLGVLVFFLSIKIYSQNKVGFAFDDIWLLVLIALPLVSFNKLSQAFISSYDFAYLSQISSGVLSPIILVTLSYTLFSLSSLKISDVFYIYFLASLCAFLLNVFLVKKTSPTPKNTTHSSAFKSKEWLSSAIVLMSLSAVYTVNSQIDIVMLGVLSDSANVGIYAVSNRITTLLVFFLSSANLVIAPSLARFYASGERKKTAKILAKVTRISFIFSIVSVVALSVFGGKILSTFGGEYAVGYWVLLILGLSQLVNSASGPVSLLMNMSGHEKTSLAMFTVSFFINLLLNYFLIPRMGIYGAAIATSCSMVAWNASSLLFVVFKMRIFPLVGEV